MITNSKKINLTREIENLILSVNLAFRSLIYSKKWLLYAILALVPMLLLSLTSNPLLSNDDAKEAYVDLFIGSILFLFFTFSCLLLSLPVSSDEISDRFFELLLVRPIRKEILWTSRWIVTHVSVLLLNFIISTLYYVFFHVSDPNAKLPDDLIGNAYLLSSTFMLLVAATLIYGGMFLTVAFIGRRGFTIGILLAIFELLFLNTLFLQDEPYIPRTNLQVIADEVFGTLFTYNPSANKVAPELWFSWTYSILAAMLFFFLGLLYLRYREYN